MNGYTGRLHQWRRARQALFSNRIPVEVVRLRVRRAAALGLDYRTYAGVRATTGRDIAALLFSSNALGMLRAAELEDARARKLAAVEAERGALMHRPLPAVAVDPLDFAAEAPLFTESWTEVRARLVAVLAARKLPADAVLMIGDTTFERSWSVTARAGGYLSAETYFGSET
ncbi:hypothetical protein K3551_07675 [Jannaschia sp. M317]|nr:hypothetical protein K3551_07675 [Jannaschia sp. M317]